MLLVPWMLAVPVADAVGCTICATAMADSVLPPIELWALLAVTWFMSIGILHLVTAVRLPLQPTPIVSLVVAIGLLIWGGTAALLVLFVPCVCVFAASFIPRFVRANEKGIRATRLVGFVHVLALACATVLTIHILNTRTPEQYIVKWATSPNSRALLAEFREREPDSLDSYRYLARHADELVVASVAERIAEIGDPELDISLLEEALARFGPRCTWGERIEAALNKLRDKQSI